jgi:hypothetical protein
MPFEKQAKEIQAHRMQVFFWLGASLKGTKMRTDGYMVAT